MKRVLSILVACLLVLSMVSFASADEEKEVVTIQYYGMQNNRASMDGYMNDYLAEKIGVRVEVIPYDAEKTQALLAGGDLPDIGRYYVNGSIASVIDSGLIMDLSDYVDQLPNLTSRWPEAVEYAREVICDGQGLYCIPLEIGTYDCYTVDTGTYDISLRWDVYNAIGCPEINSLSDLIDVLKQMMEYMPTTEDGTKTWGIGAHPAWDGTTMSAAGKVAAISGVQMGIGSSFMEYDIVNDVLRPMIDENSTYVAGVKFLFDCQQAGVLDPDSVTQTYEATQAKVASGAYMCIMSGNYKGVYNSTDHVNAENPTGYMSLCADWMKPVVNGPQVIGGGNTSFIAVSKNTDKLDACLAFINEMYDEETMLTMYNGPKGVMWDVVDGKLVSLEGFNTMYNTGSYTLESGEVLSTGAFWAAWGWTNDTLTQYGEPVRQTEWASTTALKTDTNLFKMWREDTGYYLPIDAYREKGNLTYNSLATKFMPTLDEDAQMIANSVGEVVVANSWKMVYAADEAEFWSLMNEMKEKADALGLGTLEEACVENWAVAQAKAEPYMVK